MAKALPVLYSPTFTEVRLAPGRMAKAAAWTDLAGTDRPDKPWLNGLPRIIFVSDMGDLFSGAVPFDYIKQEVIDVATGPKGSRHVWMLLTKQPRRMAEFADWLSHLGADWPGNVWAGTSITTQKTTRRIDHLVKVPSRFRFLSVEPQREFISVREWLSRGLISLVIQGGESDQGEYRGHPFNVNWARSLRDDCKDAGASYFLKQMGSHPYVVRYKDHPVKLKDSHGGDWSEWAEDLRVRQFPNVEAPTHD